MGYAAEKGVARILDWRDFTVEEANYVVEYCEALYKTEQEETRKAKA